MKIVFITQYFQPESFSNNTLAKSLVSRGHEVHAVPCVPNYPSGVFFPGYSNSERREEVWEGIQIHRTWTVARGSSAWQMILNYFVYPPSALWTMLRRIKGRPDVSFVSLSSPLFQAFAAVFLRWVRGTPCVYWVQDLWPYSVIYAMGLRNPLIVKPLHWVCGWLYRRADLVLVQSAGFPATIRDFGVAPERIRVLPNSAPEGYRPLSPEEAPDEAELVPQDGFRLMFAGNIGETQGFDTILDAAEQLQHRGDLTWVIVGSGRDEARVKAEIARRGIEACFAFLGRHPEATMPHFFAHADAMLVCLTDVQINALTVPYKVQCYMACGKPIVAALRGEGARLVDDSGAGVTALPGDGAALAGAVEQMLDMENAARTLMGSASRAYFEANFTRDKIDGDLEAWLIKAAESRK